MNTERFDKFFNFFNVPPTPLIGVDISTSTIKCVELSRGRNGEFTLENYSIEPTPRDAFNDQGIGNADALGAALERAWKKLNTKIKNICIGIPANIAISKKVKFGKELDDLAIADEVLIEANHFIPFNLEEVHIDWINLGPHPTSPETDNEILICASRRDRIVDYMAVAEAAGLKVVTVDIDSYAKQRSFEKIQDSSTEFHNEVIAVADAGSSMLQLSVFDKTDELIFTKEIAFGSNQLTDTLIHNFNLTPEQAEEAKRKGGQGIENYQSVALSPFLESLGLEINRALQFFLTQATVEKIDRIILAGGCAAYDNAASIVSTTSQIPTTPCNPFSGMTISSKLKNRNFLKEAPILMTACGLALRRFDN